MKRAVFFLPVAALLVFAGYLGVKSGQLPDETEIINRYTAAYLEIAPSGASRTDCATSPHPDPNVRLVINCVHPSGLTTTYYVGPHGAALPEPAGPEA